MSDNRVIIVFGIQRSIHENIMLYKVFLKNGEIKRSKAVEVGEEAEQWPPPPRGQGERPSESRNSSVISTKTFT